VTLTHISLINYYKKAKENVLSNGYKQEIIDKSIIEFREKFKETIEVLIEGSKSLELKFGVVSYYL